MCRLLQCAIGQIEAAYTTKATAGSRVVWWAKFPHSQPQGRKNPLAVERISDGLTFELSFKCLQAYWLHIDPAKYQADALIDPLSYLNQRDSVQQGGISWRASHAHKRCATAGCGAGNEYLDDEFAGSAVQAQSCDGNAPLLLALVNDTGERQAGSFQRAATEIDVCFGARTNHHFGIKGNQGRKQVGLRGRASCQSAPHSCAITNETRGRGCLSRDREQAGGKLFQEWLINQTLQGRHRTKVDAALLLGDIGEVKITQIYHRLDGIIL